MSGLARTERTHLLKMGDVARFDQLRALAEPFTDPYRDGDGRADGGQLR